MIIIHSIHFHLLIHNSGRSLLRIHALLQDFQRHLSPSFVNIRRNRVTRRSLRDVDALRARYSESTSDVPDVDFFVIPRTHQA